jgi:hypothetical protein
VLLLVSAAGSVSVALKLTFVFVFGAASNSITSTE